MQGSVIFSPSALVMMSVSMRTAMMRMMMAWKVMMIHLVRLAGWVRMVVAAGEVAGVEEARVSRARVKGGKSTIRNSFIPF